jgi:hypothetical protein
VGIAGDVRARLKQHQCGNARNLTCHEIWGLPTREAAADLERLIIEKFAAHQGRGREWFAIPAAPISKFIEETISEFDIRGVARVAMDIAFNEPPQLRHARAS